MLSILSLLGGGGGCRKAVPPETLGQLPEFALTSHRGTAVSRASLAGRPWVAAFIFTSCAGVCPAMTSRMVRLRKEVPASLPFVSFTVDPAHDTPEVLATYAKETGASGNWFFVTGPRQGLYDLSVHGFKLAALEVPPGERLAGGDGPFVHSSKLVLVDGTARLRGYYDSGDDEALRKLVADIGVLERENRP